MRWDDSRTSVDAAPRSSQAKPSDSNPNRPATQGEAFVETSRTNSGRLIHPATVGTAAAAPAVARHAPDRRLSECRGLKYITMAKTATPAPPIHVTIEVGQSANNKTTRAVAIAAISAVIHHRSVANDDWPALHGSI